VVRKPRGEKDYDPGLRKGGQMSHTYPVREGDKLRSGRQGSNSLAGNPIHLVSQEIEYVFKMRYLSNTLRVWTTPKVCWDAGHRNLAEAASPKDRWIESASGVEVVPYPPVTDTEATSHASTYFDGELQTARSANPEIPGHSIAPEVTNNSEVQEPPCSLGRMHACR
jgi:hypothetical protein